MNIGLLVLVVGMSAVVLVSHWYRLGYMGLNGPGSSLLVENGWLQQWEHPQLVVIEAGYIESKDKTGPWQSMWADHLRNIHRTTRYGAAVKYEYSLVWLTLQLFSIPAITVTFYFARKRRRTQGDSTEHGRM